MCLTDENLVLLVLMETNETCWPAPRIVEGPLLEERTRADGGSGLIGIHVAHPEVFGRALMASGVPEDEVSRWEIMTNVDPGTELRPQQIGLRVMDLSEQMDSEARKSKVRYSSVFKRCIADFIMSNIVNTRAPLDTTELVGRHLAGTARIAVPSCLFFSGVYPYFGGDVKGGAVTGLAFALGTGSLLTLRSISDEAKARNFISHSLLLADQGLRDELTNTILPVYFKDLSHAPRQVFSDQLKD